jgi:hypothetical protein
MSHLNPERLAELADGSPTAEESAHLASCLTCERERRAHEKVLELARITGEHELPPLTNFEVLSEQLRLEGRISSGDPTRGRFSSGAWWMRAAAAILLIASGVAIGRLSMGAAQSDGQQLAETTAVASPSFESADEARTTLIRAERDYRGALTWLAQNDSGVTDLQGPDAYRARSWHVSPLCSRSEVIPSIPRRLPPSGRSCRGRSGPWSDWSARRVRTRSRE